MRPRFSRTTPRGCQSKTPCAAAPGLKTEVLGFAHLLHRGPHSRVLPDRCKQRNYRGAQFILIKHLL